MLPDRRLAQAVALVLVMLGSAVAQAGPPTEQLQVRISRVVQTVDDPELKKNPTTRAQAIRKIADEIFDFRETAQRSLGRHWQARTPAERQEFVPLFADLLERTYISRIESYGGEKISYVGEVIDGDQATVRTTITTKQGTPVPVEYRMLRRSDRWLVYDVVIEGISLVGNYRTQFNKIIQTSSYPELVKRMRARLDELSGDTGAAPARTSRP
jgi:phospholipid transport system substrate-binding protein